MQWKTEWKAEMIWHNIMLSGALMLSKVKASYSVDFQIYKLSISFIPVF